MELGPRLLHCRTAGILIPIGVLVQPQARTVIGGSPTNRPQLSSIRMRTPTNTSFTSTPTLSVDRIFLSFRSFSILSLSQLTHQTISIMPCMAYPSGNAFPNAELYPARRPATYYHPDGPFIAGYDYPDPVYLTRAEERSNEAYQPQHSARASVQGPQFAEFNDHPSHYYPPPQHVQPDAIHPNPAYMTSSEEWPESTYRLPDLPQFAELMERPCHYYPPPQQVQADTIYPDPACMTPSEEWPNATYRPRRSAPTDVPHFPEFMNRPKLHYSPPPRPVQADTIHPRLTEKEIDLLFSHPEPVWQQYPESRRSPSPGNVEFEFEYDPDFMPVYDPDMIPDTSTVVSVGYECDLHDIDRSTSRRRADPPAASIRLLLLLCVLRSLLDVPAVFAGPRLLLLLRALPVALESPRKAPKALHLWLPQAAHAAAASSKPLLILNPRVVASLPRGLSQLDPGGCSKRSRLVEID